MRALQDEDRSINTRLSEVDGLLSKGNRKSVDRVFYVGGDPRRTMAIGIRFYDGYEFL